MISDEIVEIRRGVGTGIAWSKYYSLKRDCSSKFFWDVFATNEELIAFTDKDRKVIVRNIFDKTKTYYEFEIDFSDTSSPLITGEFINNNSQLKIKYLAGESYDEIETVLNLK